MEESYQLASQLVVGRRSSGKHRPVWSFNKRYRILDLKQQALPDLESCKLLLSSGIPNVVDANVRYKPS